jgi:hypothetical protein
MNRKTFKLNYGERQVIKEIIRRVQCFKKGNISASQVMLSYPSEIKTLVEKGILTAESNYPRCLTWSQLTETGIKILSQFKRKGLFCKPLDYDGNCGIIPNKVTIYE